MNILDGRFVVEEKVDGSQFSFGVFDRKLHARSRGAEICVEDPDKMFQEAVDIVRKKANMLRDGWTYRAEYLQKPKHNALAYSRIPRDHLAIFDMCVGPGDHLDPDEKRRESERLGFECVPLLHNWDLEPDHLMNKLQEWLQLDSFLGGQKIEGVVIKNYNKFGDDKKFWLLNS